jgi:hypothetical protein
VYQLYCINSRKERQILSLLSRTLDIQVQTSWKDFVAQSQEATCSILGTDDLASRSVRRRLFPFCLTPTLRPLVLVTTFNEVNAKALKDLCIDEVVWDHRLDADLLDSVLSSNKREYMIVLADAIQRNDRLPDQLRDALVTACISPHPIRSQKELMEYVNCHRTTLLRQWRSVDKSASNLKTVLDWILLVRATLLRTQVRSWKEVARTIGTSQSNLSAIAGRLTHTPLKLIRPSEVKDLFDRSPVAQAIFE